ncbi:hypothetical protein HYALB_00009323 [Hymenoscyphus albidus]|uniref:Uncharacterized protein n=1 Tax=Hymenoscyphus albidus TaxID=595503 RepID=A0A9N9Q856_9HELO|nr:hypothetical protein HYALB_00009323 [Hymenoscyphus albidus]
MSWFKRPRNDPRATTTSGTSPAENQNVNFREDCSEEVPQPAGDCINDNSPGSPEGQAKAASEDATLKKAFDDVMSDFGSIGKPHRQAAVLMISWTKELDDLHTKDEVTELQAVSEEQFNYNAGLEIAKHLIDFVMKYDSETGLLIVHYADHGIPGKRGELHFTGKRIPRQKDNGTAWHESEHIIRDAAADVLLIFDCCFAGNLLPTDVRSYWPARGFECIAACGKGETTHFLGEKSFTAALIWSLQTLVQKRTRFSTQELQATIMNDTPNFPEKQYVPLIERNEPSDQRLVLAPIPNVNEEMPGEPPESQHPMHHLDLRFWYPHRPDEEEISSLAKRLRNLMVHERIGASRIGWLGLKNRELAKRERIRSVADAWLSRIRRDSSGDSFSGNSIASANIERCISPEF